MLQSIECPECKRLPLGYLEPSEKELAEKCINHEEFTEEEVEELRELLARYREYFTKYDSVDFEENLDKNIKVIETSTDLLSLFCSGLLFLPIFSLYMGKGKKQLALFVRKSARL